MHWHFIQSSIKINKKNPLKLPIILGIEGGGGERPVFGLHCISSTYTRLHMGGFMHSPA